LVRADDLVDIVVCDEATSALDVSVQAVIPRGYEPVSKRCSP